MTTSRTAIATTVFLTVAVGAHRTSQGNGAAAVTACTASALQQMAPKGTTITGAVTIEAAGNQPRFCQVDGHVAVPGNEVNVRVGLPETWNDKFYFVGVGGLGSQIGSLTAGLARGYASASTDTGHVATESNWGSSRAKKVTTVIAARTSRPSPGKN